MPRSITSSVSSRDVQCVTGRSDCSGGSQATARIRAICSAVNLPPHPARGKSPSTSPMASRNAGGFSTHSMTVNCGKARCHRRRQMPMPCRSHPSLSAISPLLKPSNARRMISARWANPCGQDREKAIACSAAC